MRSRSYRLLPPARPSHRERRQGDERHERGEAPLETGVRPSPGCARRANVEEAAADRCTRGKRPPRVRAKREPCAPVAQPEGREHDAAQGREEKARHTGAMRAFDEAESIIRSMIDLEKTLEEGVLAPAQAYDPAGFLSALAEHGVRYSVE